MPYPPLLPLPLPQGTYAEYAVGSEDAFVHMPPGVSFAQAAAVPLAAMTAWQVREEGRGGGGGAPGSSGGGML
jgi:NADPH2:quinone reductase